MNKRLLTVGVTIAAGALVLSACQGGGGSSSSGSSGSKSGKSGKAGSGGGLKKSKSINVSQNQAFFSVNADTNHGNAAANANILYMMNDSFGYYDPDLHYKPNKSFGTEKKISDKPLKVQYKLADTAKWSDGTPVTAADMLLEWAATSTNFNTVSQDKGVNKNGDPKKQSGKSVFFESDDEGMELVKKMPKVSDDNKTITVDYSKPYVDWKYELSSPAVPAHVVAQHALGIKDAKKGNQAIVQALKSDDKKKLSKIANFWNTGYDFKSMPDDKSLLVHTGPMKMTEYKKNQYLTLKKDKNYKGSHKPKVNQITVRYQGKPMSAVQALDNGEVDIIQPQATTDVLKAVKKLDNVKTQTANGATYEHVDLAENNKGPFDPKSYGGDKDKARMVRQAFLDTVPRKQIVDKLIKPLNPKAEVRNSFTKQPDEPAYDQVAKASQMAKTDKVNISEAKSLLKKAGKKHPTVRVMTDKKNKRRQQEYQLIADSAKKAGFKMVNDSSPDWGELLTQTSKYDMALFGWQSTSTGVSESVANYKTGGQNNFYGYSNKKVDKWLKELKVSTSKDQANKLLAKVEKQLVKDAFGDTIYQFPQITSWNKKLDNAHSISLSPTLFWNFWKWDIS